MSNVVWPFTDLILQLPETIPFVGPEALERRFGRSFRARVGANESAFGISPLAREAMQEAVDQVAWYNDPENFELREALSAFHHVNFECVTVGGGIDDLLGLAVRALLSPGDPVVTSLGAYPTFHYHVNGFGGEAHCVPYRNGYNDLDGLANKVREVGARLAYLSTPDNPAGTWHSAADQKAFLDALPRDCVLVLDEAYYEFATKDDVLPMDLQDDRVIRMRTFSKAHGMAGARVGYAIAAPEIVKAFDKIRLQFGVNRIAQAGALASLSDQGFVDSVIAAVGEGRADYEALGSEVGLMTLPSATNFVTFEAGNKTRADEILERLQQEGVFVRKPGAPPLDSCFRVTVGTPDERKVFGDSLRVVLAECRN